MFNFKRIKIFFHHDNDDNRVILGVRIKILDDIPNSSYLIRSCNIIQQTLLSR